MIDEDPDDVFEDIVPFIVIESKGGPYEDTAYRSGFEAGLFFGLLMQEPDEVASLTLTANLSQLDLIAMHFGYMIESEVMDDDDNFSMFTMTRVSEEVL